VSGRLDFISDTDWYRIQLQAGYAFQIYLEGSASGLGTLWDPYVAVQNLAGNVLAWSDDIALSNLDSNVHFIPSVSGTYFISAEESGNNATGSYLLTVWQDQLASASTAATLSANSTIADRIGWGTDYSDWYAITLTAGVSYQFDATGSTQYGATYALLDPYLILRNASGTILLSDDDGGNGLDSRIFFTPIVSGTYYLDVQESGVDGHGVYALIVNETPVAGTLEINAPWQDSITFQGDFDLLAITLTSGISYGFSINGQTLTDPFLELMNSNGVVISSDDDNGPGLNSLLAFTPTESGTYYLAARAANYASLGSYTALAWELPSLSIEDAFVLEGNTSSNSIGFPITLSNASPSDITLTIGTRAGTASTASGDYQGIWETNITIPAGQTSTVFSIPVSGDTEFEPNEGFGVVISNPVMATIADGDARGWIFDDDAPYPLPSDPLSRYQWHLYPDVGANVLPVWESWNGSGIKVAVFDQGIDATHPDLNDNLVSALGRRASGLAEGGDPILAADNHGTPVAGVIAAEANGDGVIGVAPKASLVSIYSTLASSPTSFSAEISNAFEYAQSFDVLNNSWGFGNYSRAGSEFPWAFLDNFRSPTFEAAGQDLKELADHGRNGLGTVVVQSAGNSFSLGDDTNLHNFQNSRYIITVAGTDYQGTVTSYSSPGASVLVAAPGGEVNINNDALSQILTTDRVGSAGYDSSDYTFIAGTSFSGPVVSGVVALMLDANPTLGYRDVQQIIAYSGRRIAEAENDWKYNGASNWNGGGLHYDSANHNLGFGLIDALTAVRLAESWSTPSQTSANDFEHSVTLSTRQTIPDGTSFLQQSVSVTQAMEVERVEVTIDISHTYIGDLDIVLTSPAGTKSWLLSRPGQSEDSPFGQSQDNINFTFNTVLSLGEGSVGTWTLSISDNAFFDAGTLNSWTLNLIGKPVSDDDVYVYTHEFSESVADQAYRATLTDSGGIDQINTSAVSAATSLNLQAGSQSSIDGRALSIGTGAVIEHAVTGDGDDSIFGNEATNYLRGMRGNDSLSGGEGNDSLEGGMGDDTLSGGLGADTFEVGAGTDSISDLGNGADILTVAAGATTNATVTAAWTATAATTNSGVAKITANGMAVNLSAVTTGSAGYSITNTGAATTLTGSALADSLTGGAGNDTLVGGGGNDTIVGGAGSVDTAAYMGDQTGFVISRDGDNWVVKDVNDDEGLDILINIERIQFADGSLDLTTNMKATGTVTISGSATQGQTLTAANTLADIDGLGTISYQWMADGANISDATASTLALSQAHVGQAISVTASFTDAYGHAESVTSAATAAVANVNDSPTGSVTITGTATQGQTLTAGNTLADIDGIPESGVGAISYHWSAGAAVIANATGSTYVLTQAEVGKAITVVASYTDQQGTAESKASSATVSVANVNDSPTGSVTITGTATQGQTLTAGNTLADIDGIPESGVGAISYQWSAGGTVISNATGSTYVLTQAEVGKAISVTASYTDQQGTAESKTSSATTSVANVNDSPTGSVTITGTATQGQTLTAGNTLADIDGIPESGVGAISYQWSADAAVIANATGSTCVLTQAEVGKAISVTASYTDQQGTAESKASSATTSVANVNDSPTGSVTITGTATQGQTLTAANTLADIDGIPSSDSGAISYQWSAGGAAIANATGSTYVLTQAEVGKAISVTASYTDQQGTAESKASSATANVANVNDSPTGSVTITGTATQGQTLTAANTLADVDGIPESGVGAISYQWSAGGAVISNATGSTYVLTQAEVGKAISVTASYTDQQGTAESKASSATTSVANINDAPTGSVTISGTATQGQTLTAGNTLADVDGIPESGVGAISYQWQWSTDGNMPWTSIDGTLGDALKLSSAHLGHHIRVLGSYTDEQGLLEAVASHAVLITLDANFVAYSWKAHTLLAGVDLTAGTHSSSTDSMGAAGFKAITQSNLSLSASRTVPADEAQATTNAVNLQDAIAILKMIVGLNVNGANQPLSPYQALAADFDGNSRVELNDAIGVLKHVVGLTGTGTPKPEWRFVDEASAAVVAIKDAAALSPGQPPAINLDLTGADATVQVGLVGYLRGDVDGSFAGAAGALDLDDAQPGYFTALVAEQPALNLAQFGIYTVG
jgi:subtilisin-like proprotein convertase family protein/subtilisin family serine protease